MTEKTKQKRSGALWTAAGVIILALVLTAGWLWMRERGKPAEIKASALKPTVERLPVHPPAMIDTGQIEKNSELHALMEKRKKEYGVGSGVDIIAKPGETLKVGKNIVPMNDVLNKIQSEKRQITETDLMKPSSSATPDIYGIYVVQPGDNVWDVHFRILKSFFAQKGVTLSRWADQPLRNGDSSGVGRILKYSETMVSIYNIQERRVETNLNLLRPFSKIVVFNIGQALEVLKQIDYGHINTIRFDGKKLWISSRNN